tara:strand:- start:237 stop:500 length:264 start_codon:yes stop_codon:yes gene_type:complete
MKVNWAELISKEMKENNDALIDIVFCTLTNEEMVEKFNDGYGGSEGKPFTCWTTNHVYFPVVYDGAEWVGSVPRNPRNRATSHFGGE